MDKRSTAQIFRQRLGIAVAASAISHAGLARATGADRSTISALLRDDETRLPNAHLVANCARVLGVSADWLLGLSDFQGTSVDLLANAVHMPDAERGHIDAQIFAWHQEAAGYKIRHVPAGLPDLMKTPEMLEWEYAPTLERTTAEAIEAASTRIEWMDHSGSEYEIALPIHDLHAFARGEGYYANCPIDIRRAQLDHMAMLYDQLYPRLRLHLFDAHKLYSAPVTIFGPLVGAIYLGQKYLVFRDKQRVGALTAHFDSLIRLAEIGSRGFGPELNRLSASL